jgi:hypothetical protein
MASYPRVQSLYIAAVESLGFIYFTYFLFGGQSTGCLCHTKNWLVVRGDVAISPVIRVIKCCAIFCSRTYFYVSVARGIYTIKIFILSRYLLI